MHHKGGWASDIGLENAGFLRDLDTFSYIATSHAFFFLSKDACSFLLWILGNKF